MLYRFQSKSSATVLMLHDAAEPLLRALGREPGAQGLLAAADLPALIQGLERAIEAQEQPQAATDGDDAPDTEPVVDFKRRAWPLLEMMRRAAPRGHDIVWTA